MFKHWIEATRVRIKKVKGTLRKWAFYTKITLLILFIIMVVLLLTWALTIVHSAMPNTSQEARTPVQTSTPSSNKTSLQPSLGQKEISLKTTVSQQQTQQSESLQEPKGFTTSNKSQQRSESIQKPDESAKSDQTPPFTVSPKLTAVDNELASPSQPEAESIKKGHVREFTVTSYSKKVQIDDQLTFNGWTYNGVFPGPVIRVKEGERVRVKFRNQIPDIGTSIHFHGIPKPNNMDGVPYITQPSVNYGGQFTYEFTAEPAGMYIYHAHGGSLQANKGLIGPMIIEPTGPTTYPDTDTEWIVGLDESKIPGEGNPPPATDGNRMNQSMMQQMMPNALLGTADLYNVFTINGKRGPKQVFKAEANEWVQLRLFNYGFQTHRIKVEGMKMYVTHNNAPLPAAQRVKYVEISPYERIGVYLIGDKPGKYKMLDIDPGHSELGMRANVELTPSGDNNNPPKPLKIADPPDNAPKYQGITAGIPGPDTTNYDRVYNMDLGMTMGSNGMSWGINGVGWGDLGNFEKIIPYKVRQGEMIKINLFNRSPESHPMHLHGHHFRIVAINGQTLAESWLVKDVINVRPMQRFSIAFKADNPGNWLFHCHQEHHADSGLMTYFSYVESDSSE